MTVKIVVFAETEVFLQPLFAFGPNLLYVKVFLRNFVVIFASGG